MKKVEIEEYYTSFDKAAFAIEKHKAEGWKIVDAYIVGFRYYIRFCQYTETVEAGKPTRAEILEKARAAKRAKQGEKHVS